MTAIRHAEWLGAEKLSPDAIRAALGLTDAECNCMLELLAYDQGPTAMSALTKLEPLAKPGFVRIEHP
jgi:predicted transcriptional regulator